MIVIIPYVVITLYDCVEIDGGEFSITIQMSHCTVHFKNTTLYRIDCSISFILKEVNVPLL